ncbi:uncharacterized protein ASPGLDRAFT_126845 [Aspergillus glaucus CBS 516.65]|uniref:Uncharacterized protein n=1 Tax=Aspergillus glaucus CBS 516.65 TaxID=1160497 RepID=A0A1L9VJ84_ASPGL|nr:hypothetical protein ASPGLDRAFT_126845 [Aspergillus glaucus CBS 516.65]OJJ83991.1 hypothetical protein ASPGLDRAFT_126845 [Aspergillus glaucus CBS 516.65]
MEDHPDHWKSTLLGEDFWKDAEVFNQVVNDDIEAEQILHKFPFNLGPEQGPAPRSPSRPGRRRRRFSMNDAFSLSSLNLSPSRLLGRRSRSSSRSHSPTRPPSVLSETRRTSSRLRFAFTMTSNNGKKRYDDADTDSIYSIPLRGPNDPGTPEKPLMFFRGGASWNVLPRDMQAIGIDLFWPVKQNQEGDREVLHIEEMVPLCQFRGLRVLKITGMLQSYQKYIWQAAWLNTELEELELGMAIGPRIRRNFPGDWPFIKGGWALKQDTYGEPVYYGHMGTGNLHRTIGIGEYLDKTSIEKAKVRAMATGRTLNRLSIKTLTLNGFVVDADPILLWFDPKMLRCINFRDNCVDAGFYLCRPMRKVEVKFPTEIEEKAVTVRKVDVRRELKIVDLRGGKKVSEAPYPGRESHSLGSGDGDDTQKTESREIEQRMGDMTLDSPEKEGIRTTTVVEIENIPAYDYNGDGGSYAYYRNVFVSISPEHSDYD